MARTMWLLLLLVILLDFMEIPGYYFNYRLYRAEGDKIFFNVARSSSVQSGKDKLGSQKIHNIQAQWGICMKSLNPIEF